MPRLETELQKHYDFRVAELTHAQVEAMDVCKLGHAEIVMLLQFGFEARHIGRGEQILIHIDTGCQLQEHLAPGGIVAVVGPLPEPRAQSFGKLVVHISAVILSDTKLFRSA